MAFLGGELMPSERARFLSHTERCSGCALVVAEAGLVLCAPEAPGASHAAASVDNAVFSPGQLVAARYLIERRIGRGGMGEVYAAFDRELNDRVALKTISLRLSGDPQIVERFKLELRLARSIAHPSVCRVLEFGRHELGGGVSQCFFTMQFIAGGTLRRQLLEHRALELTRALTIAVDLARGLQAIHAQNVVHRDIKPENIMLPSGSDQPAAVWVDFGLARVDMRETASAAVLAGTPDYAAPELLQGCLASRASDLYSFGVVLFELTTGRLPFARARSFATAFEQARTGPPRPSALRSEVPGALDALVLDCLASAPEQRPASAGQVAERLTQIAHALRASQAENETVSVTVGHANARWRWVLGAALLSALAATFNRLPSNPSTPALPSAPAPVVGGTSNLSAELAPVPSVEPPPSARKNVLKRPLPAAPAALSASAAPASSESPRVTDFGGRR